MCLNMNCKNQHHGTELCAMYENIVTALNTSSKSLCKRKSNVHYIKPGWNDFVTE